MRFVALALVVLIIAPVAGASPQLADLASSNGETSADMCHAIPCCPVFNCSFWLTLCQAVFGPTLLCPWW